MAWEFVTAAAIYLLPSFLFVYMAAELFTRNPKRTVNRLSVLIMLTMAAYAAGAYLQTVFPADSTGPIVAYMVIPQIVLGTCFGMHFYYNVTSFGRRLKRPFYIVCYSPALLYAAAVLYGGAGLVATRIEDTDTWSTFGYGPLIYPVILF